MNSHVTMSSFFLRVFLISTGTNGIMVVGKFYISEK